MFSRALAIPALLVAATGVPFVVSNSPEWAGQWSDAANRPLRAAPFQSQQAAATPADLTARLTTSPTGPGSVLYPTATPLEGASGFSLADVFNLGVSKQWVYRSWPRKSTGLADIDTYGVRVPLVTGTQLQDVAGSLTYFFDSSGQVQRISFYGHTGDTTQLVMLLTQRYGLQRQPSVVIGEQLFQVRRGNEVLSELRTKPASVLWASSPHNSFTVELELQRADVAEPLPRRHLIAKTKPAPPQQAPKQQKQASKQAAGQKADKAKKETEETWRAFFPRSRVPKSHVENLDKRGHLW